MTDGKLFAVIRFDQPVETGGVDSIDPIAAAHSETEPSQPIHDDSEERPSPESMSSSDAIAQSAVQMHPAAIEHLPPFVTAPGQTDVLMWVMGIFLIFAVVGIGVFYFKLHALPERIAHRGQQVQFQIVAVLGLLALFTHNHAFWIAGLLLALVPLPDLTTPLKSMARSLDRLSASTASLETNAALSEHAAAEAKPLESTPQEQEQRQAPKAQGAATPRRTPVPSSDSPSTPGAEG